MSAKPMSSLLANRSVRRKGAAYIALLVASLLLLTVSSNPFVRDLQHGLAFAFKPFQVAVDGLASDVRWIFSTIVEIDEQRQRNPFLEAENDRLEAEVQTAAELRREKEALPALLPLRSGLEYQATAVTVIARDANDVRRT